MKLRIKSEVMNYRELLMKAPVVCSRSLGELLEKINKVDPVVFGRTKFVTIDDEVYYSFKSENCEYVPLVPGNCVYLYCRKRGANRIGFGFFVDAEIDPFIGNCPVPA